MKILSGIQPSGLIHIGNYLGAIKQHIELQHEADKAFYTIVDLHAITVPQDPKKLKKQTLETAALYLALGLESNKATLFVQSQLPEHAELGWIFTTLTNMGELERMTQFKDKGRGQDRSSVGVGLLAYPTLMAADILIYKPTHVPVGEDQVQHVELTRDLAKRFNQRFGETFPVPEVKIVKQAARIMGLDDPTKKMSKSATSEYNYVALTDAADVIRKKISKAVTDSGSDITYSNDRPAIKNLLTIFSGVTNRSIEDLENAYKGKGYAEFKKDLAEALIDLLKPVQSKFNQIMDDEDHLIDLLHKGADKARGVAIKTVKEVKEKVGFLI